MSGKSQNANHRLILVEGLPCSGKSTTAKYVAGQLNMQFFDEGSGEHPADYAYHAFVQSSELCNFSGREQEHIRSHSAPGPGGLIIPLSPFSGELLEKLLPYKIYDFLPWEIERPVMLDKWREFVDSATPADGYVFNCVFLQNPMCETMMRFGFDQAESAGYIREIRELIRPLSPFVIYLKTENIRDRILQTVPERGDEWLGSVIGYHCTGTYGKRHHLSGFEGYIAALEERQRRELEILENLDMDYMVLDHPELDWEKSYREILNRLCTETSLRLVRPGMEWKEKALAFRQEFFDHGEPVIYGSELLDKTEHYEEWLNTVTRNTDPETVSPDWVLTDTFFTVDGTDEIVGIIDLRHELNGFLADLGNCGYSVRPARRKEGYGRQMLRLVKDAARDAGLTELYISVERENIPSVKVIGKNGGEYERSFIHEGQPADVYRIIL